MLDFFLLVPTCRGLSAASRTLQRSLDPADKPRDVGLLKAEYCVSL